MKDRFASGGKLSLSGVGDLRSFGGQTDCLEKPHPAERQRWPKFYPIPVCNRRYGQALVGYGLAHDNLDIGSADPKAAPRIASVVGSEDKKT